jgi:hypothetical protein
MTSSSGVYLGEAGCIELQRVSGEKDGPDLIVSVTKGDINETFNSLSFDPFNVELGQLALTTGDRINMTTDWENPAGATVIAFDDAYDIPNSLPDGVYKDLKLVSRTGTGRGATIAELTIKNGRIRRPDDTGYAITSTTFDTDEQGAFYEKGDDLTLQTSVLGKVATDVRFKVKRVIKATDTLWFFDGSPVSKAYYVHVNRAGNISFHETFDGALQGKGATRIPLSKPADAPSKTKIYIQFSNSFRRWLAQVTEFTINTTREFVDTTALGQEYVEKYKAGEITGSGSIKCQWNFRGTICDTDPTEFVQYLAQILLRTEVGSEFAARFFLYYNPEDKSAWYDCPTCLVQKVGVSVSPDEIIFMDVEFLMSGPFSLQTGRPPSYLLIEDADESYVYQEDESAGFEVELYENEDD